jgi:hypothetical protein
MTVAIPITIAPDVSMGAGMHNGFLPPVVPAPVPQPSIEMIATMMWTAGYLLNKNKLTTKVEFNGWPIVQDGHDVGPLIPDITPMLPANLWYAMMWPFSSRKNAFCASKVLADGAPLAGHYRNLMTMVTCGEPLSLPTAVCMTNELHNCDIGFELSDIAFGFIGIIAGIVVEKLSAALGSRLNARFPIFAVAQQGTVTVDRYIRQTLTREAINRFRGFSDAGGLVKLALAPVVEGALSYARGQVNGTGDWSVKAAVGNPWVGVEGSYTGSRTASEQGFTVQRATLHRQVSHSFVKRSTTVSEFGRAQPETPWDAAPAAPPKTPALNARPASAPGGAR